MGVDLIVLQQLAVAFGLGLLLGLQGNTPNRRSAAFARFR